MQKNAGMKTTKRNGHNNDDEHTTGEKIRIGDI